MGISDVLTGASTVYATLLSFFQGVVNTITTNGLLAIPVILALCYALIKLSIRVAKKLGLRGMRG